MNKTGFFEHHAVFFGWTRLTEYMGIRHHSLQESTDRESTFYKFPCQTFVL